MAQYERQNQTKQIKTLTNTKADKVCTNKPKYKTQEIYKTVEHQNAKTIRIKNS